MIADEVRAALRAPAFKTFTIHVAEQTSYDVPNRDWAIVNPDGSDMVVLGADGLFHFINMAHVTRVTGHKSMSAAM